MDAWERIDVPKFVLDWIKYGVRIPFKAGEDNISFELNNRQFSDKEETFIDGEISRFLSADWIERCDVKPICVNPILCVPKKNNKLRLITDLRSINEHCAVPHYRNEDIKDTVRLVKSGDYFVTADIKDGFFHVPIAKEDRDYLGFYYKGFYYRWKVLPFGLSCSPFYFNKVLRPVITYLRSVGLRVTVFVDDFLLAFDFACATDHIDQFIHTLTDLGFVINFEKSQLVPSQTVKYIGYTLCSDQDSVRIKAQATRIAKLKRSLRKAIQQQRITFRTLAQICGQCVSVAWVVTPGKLFLRHAYR